MGVVAGSCLAGKALGCRVPWLKGAGLWAGKRGTKGRKIRCTEAVLIATSAEVKNQGYLPTGIFSLLSFSLASLVCGGGGYRWFRDISGWAGLEKVGKGPGWGWTHGGKPRFRLIITSGGGIGGREGSGEWLGLQHFLKLKMESC